MLGVQISVAACRLPLGFDRQLSVVSRHSLLSQGFTFPAFSS
jgi:hypothetical protein